MRSRGSLQSSSRDAMTSYHAETCFFQNFRLLFPKKFPHNMRVPTCREKDFLCYASTAEVVASED